MNSRLLGNSFVSVDDHESTRPSGRLAALIAMCGHAITGPQDPSVDTGGGGGGGGGSPPATAVFMSFWISDCESARL